ncbi:hypothetical protein ACT3R7_11785 [Halomonas sp. AOP43-A1-21]
MSLSLPALSLCPAVIAAGRAMHMAFQGAEGACAAVATEDTGMDEPGFYPAWKTGDSTIVGITEHPFLTEALAVLWMRHALSERFNQHIR